MVYSVVFTPESEAQLVDLYGYIAVEASPEIAARFTDGIVTYCESLSTFPNRGDRREDIRPGLRVTNYRKRVAIAFDVEETGLRVSELLALRWGDVDFENLELRVTRSIWHQVVGNCKTEASAKPVPMDSYMADDLLSWRRQSIYSSNDDYVFASETMRGKQPYWPDNLMKRHIRPVAKANGIHKKIGWHTFRHSFGTLLKANGEDVKTVQELLRHANSRITLDVYTQAVNSNKRAAQSKVVKMMVSNVGTKVADVGTTDSKKQAQSAG